MSALHRLDIAGLASLLRGGAKVRSVVDAMLARADSLDPALHLFVQRWPDAARTAADAMDRVGPVTSALWGVPVAHKDIFARPDRQPSCGIASPTGLADLPPAPAIAAMQAACVVELGATNLAEFALGTTGTNAFFGDVGNPWNPAHCSGASSSGSAAVVAAGVAWGSLGTDTGASCRVPASFCGVVGLKPTHGAVPTEGVFPLAFSLDTVGVLARSAADCATLFGAVRRGKPRTAPGRAVVGLPRRYYTDHAEPEVLAALARAAAVMEAAGHRVIDVDVVETAEIRSLTRLIMRTEAAATHRSAMRDHPGNYPLAVRKFITGGEGLLAVDYVDALRLRAPMLRQALATSFAEADVLLTPSCPLVPPSYAAIADAGNASAWQVIARLAHTTQPSSYLGQPALAVPFALTPSGLPVGMQLIGRPHEEDTLFAAAAPLERHWMSLAAFPPFAL